MTIDTISQALENIYHQLGGERNDLDLLTVPQVLERIAPLVSSGGGGGGGGASGGVEFLNPTYDEQTHTVYLGVSYNDIVSGVTSGKLYAFIAGDPSIDAGVFIISTYRAYEADSEYYVKFSQDNVPMEFKATSATEELSMLMGN